MKMRWLRGQNKPFTSFALTGMLLGTLGGAAPVLAATVHGGGAVQVAYAGSLQLVNDQSAGPAFTKATGYGYQGRGEGSLALAHLIAGGEIAPDVFESIGTAPVQLLMPRYTTWAVGFASSPLVVAYSPVSPFAPELNRIRTGKMPLKDLFALMQRPDFHLGRTNPETDPQGQLFVMMVQLAQKALHLPADTVGKVLGPLQNPRQVFQETAILSRLQAGQLDASSAFLPEAVERHLPYIALPAAFDFGNPAEARVYRSALMDLGHGRVVHGSTAEIYLSPVRHAGGRAGYSPGGLAFISFLLSKTGKSIYEREGFTLTSPQIFGNLSGIPAAIKAELK